METADRPPNLELIYARVEADLRRDPCHFDFFQAVRVLQLRSGRESVVGRYGDLEREAVRFRVYQSLAFPASQIQKIEWREKGPPEMYVNFMGLTGASGVLPYNYTRLVVDRLRAEDRTLAEFLDIFHHRLLSLFYQAWEKYRFPVAYERDGVDRFSRQVACFIGMGTPGMQRRLQVEDESLLYYAGLLGLQTRSATALESMLEDYFRAPFQVEQFIGAWYPLAESDQCSFGDLGAAADTLGGGAVVGDEVWSQQARARIRIGPLPRERYDQFLPDGSAFEPLKQLTRFFAGYDVDFEVQLVLERESVPPCLLGEAGGDEPRLGWVTWVKSGDQFDRDPSDTVFPLG
ncbi:MAG: type VI secretion system baseplate subunit TssG [Acidobacteria bacterium]|nr:type VI secretion system baseplate subunit TssG [Acidobacteriota bacterium]